MALSRSVVPAFLSRDWWDVWDFPSRIVDQHFGLGLSPEDYVAPSYFMRPVQRQLSQRDTGHSTVKNEPGSFQVMLDVSHFNPNEITVKTVDNNVVINGKHEEKADQHGFISRQFTRRYMLPSGVEPETVTSSLSPDGILTIQGRKKAIEPLPTKEREVPITMSVPAPVEGSTSEGKSTATAADSKPQEAKAAAEEAKPQQPATVAPEATLPAEKPKQQEQATPVPEGPKPDEQPAPAAPAEAKAE